MFILPIFCLLSVSSAKITRASNTVFKNPHMKASHLRILGGHNLEEGDYSFAILLVVYDNIHATRVCSASMLTEIWGITAGHCAGKRKLTAWYTNFTVSPQITKFYSDVLEMFIHPSYRALTTNNGRDDLLVNNDICLFRVGSKIDLKSYGKLSAVDFKTMIGLPVTYVGGGWTEKNGVEGDRYRPMQVGEGAIVTCHMKMSSISKYIICVTPKCTEKLHRPWYGDSGGPLIYDGKIIGVCSYGIESDVMTLVGYAPISPYIEWIYDVMNSKK